MAELSPQSLVFSLDEESGDLHAQFDPTSVAPVPNVATAKQALTDQGLGDLYVDDTALAGFITECRTAKQVLDCVVGGRRDGEFQLKVDDDLMMARLTLVPAQGGKPVGLALVDALREQGIVYGILHDRIDAALASGRCEDMTIARGDPPQDGRPGRFVNLFEQQHKQAITDDERAIIKYGDLCRLLLVHPGDPLLRRIPPVIGKNGTDIRGQVVLAAPIPDNPFASDLLGAAPDQANPDLLLATHAGQPALAPNGAIVNPVIEVPDVDLGTGNINFEGTIRVSGDIKAGMRINVTGDVIVDGVIEAADILAHGNVAVKGGIIGHTDTRSGTHVLPASTARIRCEGSVQALFAEHAHIEAGNAILLERSARQCELVARNEVVVGTTGQIIGGLTQATFLVKTAVLGSPAGIKTVVQVGVDPYLNDELMQKERQLRSKLDEIGGVLKLITYMKHSPKKVEPGVLEKAEITRLQLVREINAMTADLALLREKIELAEHAKVEVGKAIHDGVEIRVGKLSWQALEDMKGAVVQLKDGQIVVGA